MRITNNTMTNNFLSSLNKSLARESNLQEQLADGKAIHRPSDDPVKTSRSLRYNTSLSLNTQYTQNAKDAQSWMQTTDSAMSDLSSIMISIREKVVQAGDGSNPQAALQALGTDIDGMINEMVNVGNTKLGDRYVFAGQQDQTLPLIRTGDVITYNGDTNKISMPIQPGVATPGQDSVNLTGQDVFGANMSALNNLIAIKQHLMSGTPTDQQWVSTTGLANLDTDHTQMLQSYTELGSRMSMYQMAQNMMEGTGTTINQDIANNDDLDITKAITDLKTNETVYQTALQAGAKIMQKTLADFLS